MALSESEKRRALEVFNDEHEYVKVSDKDVQLWLLAWERATQAREGSKLPDYSDLPEDICEALELAVLDTISDEDHWCADAAENVYEVLKKHFDAAPPKSEKAS